MPVQQFVNTGQLDFRGTAKKLSDNAANNRLLPSLPRAVKMWLINRRVFSVEKSGCMARFPACPRRHIPNHMTLIMMENRNSLFTFVYRWEEAVPRNIATAAKLGRIHWQQ